MALNISVIENMSNKKPTNYKRIIGIVIAVLAGLGSAGGIGYSATPSAETRCPEKCEQKIDAVLHGINRNGENIARIIGYLQID